MDEAWDFAFISRIADSCMSFMSEFVDDWLTNDMRVSIFKILLGWLVFSLIAIHFAWKVYGNTVNDMYYRQGEIICSFNAYKSFKVLNPIILWLSLVLMFRYRTEWRHT